MNFIFINEKITLIILVLLFSFFIGCNENRSAEIDRSIGIPEDFKPVYSIASTRNISGAGINRIAVIIIVPKGLSKEQLAINMKIAAKKHYLKTYDDEVIVFAYLKGTDLNNSYSAGKCEFDATAGYKAEIDISEYYFKPAAKTLAIGTKIVLIEKTFGYIRISRLSNSWMDDDIISTVKIGTKAEIVDVKVFPIPAGGIDIVRYKVKLLAKNITGWVHSFDVKKI